MSAALPTGPVLAVSVPEKNGAFDQAKALSMAVILVVIAIVLLFLMLLFGMFGHHPEFLDG